MCRLACETTSRGGKGTGGKGMVGGGGGEIALRFRLGCLRSLFVSQNHTEGGLSCVWVCLRV